MGKDISYYYDMIADIDDYIALEEDTVCLDGHFTVSDLRRIAYALEGWQEEHDNDAVSP